MRKRIVTTMLAAGAITLGLAVGQELRADEQSHGTDAKEVVTPLLKTPVLGAEGKEVVIAHLSAPPGFVTTRHYHPGQLFVYVVAGSVSIELDGEAPVKLGPGDVFQETPGHPMVGKNLSATHGAEAVIFQIGDVGAPMQVDTE